MKAIQVLPRSARRQAAGALSTVPGRRGRISVMWTRTLALLMGVVLALGGIAFGATLYQRSAFDQTTTQLETELAATVSLVRELRTIDIPMGSIFYEFGTPAELDAHVRTFTERRAKIDAAFDDARRLLPVRSADDPLATAWADWTKTADAVMEARKLWGTGVVKNALASGHDPFSEEWTQLRRAQGELTELTAESLAALRVRTAEVDRVQRVVPVVVLGALVLTLLMGGWSARRLSRRIVAPVLGLRNAAARMRDGDLHTPVDIGSVGAELQDLAQAMNELAHSLSTSHDKLRIQAYTDALTGLPNRKAMVEHLTDRTRANRKDGTAVLFIDLDDFKVVNDSLGHDAGDTLLTTVAARLLSSIRDGDLAARLGGDEFAIVLAGGHDPSTAVTVADRVLAALSSPVTINNTSVTVGCSIGIALTGTDDVSAEDLLRNADMAMYLAKSGGKNRTEVFSQAMYGEMVAQMNLKVDLAHAADRNELVLHYQPVIDLSTDEILGWEALVRWQHPERGLLPPGAFIPIAEDTGDIVRIGEWVLDRACEDFVGTLAAGSSERWISINVSANQLCQPDFADTVKQTLERWSGVAPRSLVLEVTETALVTSSAQAITNLASLQQEGIRIALDDFGTGYSSLHRLQELPVDIIKIDRSFVKRAGTLQASGMLEALITIGTSLGLDMIAEGIERRPELERLKRLGGVAGQGYLIARPMPVAQARTHSTSDLDAAPGDRLAGQADACLV